MGIVAKIITGILSSVSGIIFSVASDTAVQILLIFIFSDMITGLICSAIFKKSQKTEDGSFSCREAAKGIFKKAAYFLVLIVAQGLDIIAGTDGTVRESTAVFFIANEGMSIVKNLGLMGVPLPEVIRNIFTELRNNDEKEEK